MVASARALGLPDERDVISAYSPALVPDPRGSGKLHARDVISYDRKAGPHSESVSQSECESIAHVDGTDDYSRFWLLDDIPPGRGRHPSGLVLDLVPPSLRRAAGRMSADYFRYTPYSDGAPAHQDKFGDLVVIWVLERTGGGAESFLMTLDGKDVMRGPVRAGDLLIFRDEMFLHGVTELAGGHRDALIFITLKDGA